MKTLMHIFYFNQTYLQRLIFTTCHIFHLLKKHSIKAFKIHYSGPFVL